MSRRTLPPPPGGDGCAPLDAVFSAVVRRAGPLAVAAADALRGGRRLRARLALDCAAALGADDGDALRWAAACELLHAASLVHDDLQDGDEARRGAPSAWVAHGGAVAIALGDLFVAEAFAAASGVRSPGGRAELPALLARGMAAAVRGQAEGFASLAPPRLTPRAWTAAARGKAGALFALPAEGAVVLAGGGTRARAAARRAAERIGVAYQILDDRDDLAADLAHGAPNAVAAAFLAGPASAAEAAALRALLAGQARETGGADPGAWAARIGGSSAAEACAAGALRLLAGARSVAARDLPGPLAAELGRRADALEHRLARGS